jgi:hypothetical protein
MLSDLLRGLRNKMIAENELTESEIEESDDEEINEKILQSGNWMTQFSGKSQTYVPSAEMNIFIKIMETLRKLFKDIIDAETKSMNTLTIKQVFSIITQVRNSMADTCGTCPVRKEIGKKLMRMKIMNLEKGDSE